jgi:hypothetical protein
MLTNQQILETMQIGFNDFMNDEVTRPLPYEGGDVPQNTVNSLISGYAYERGIMYAREGFQLEDDDLEFHVEEIIEDSGVESRFPNFRD